MVHTLPDYTTKYKMTKIFGNIDTGELAARLGSIDTFDRRGNILWMDDFEEPIMRWLDTSAANADVMLRASYPCRSAQNLYFLTNNVAWSFASVQKLFPYPLSDRLGFEFWFALEQDTSYVELQLVIDNGTNALQWRHKIDVSANQLEVYNHLGNFDIYETLPNNILANRWGYNVFKLAIDMNTVHYIRSLFNNVEYDLSAYRPQSGASIGNYYIDCSIILRTTAAAFSHMYLDGFIYTFNEP